VGALQSYSSVVPYIPLWIPAGRTFGISKTARTFWISDECYTAGVAMFHQMHCLQVLRNTIVHGGPDHHVRHCLNLLRQTVLCASDTTLDAMNLKHGTDGLGVVHVCRDWQSVYDFVEENQLKRSNLTG
jgi:hypothetical protein